ncbi:MAG: 4Fe-4S binding protein [Methylophaga sp.]|nr:4Fe-4S binding protein [Methylophaga sp.]
MHSSIIEAGESTPLIEEWIEFKSQGRCLVLGEADQVAPLLAHLTTLNLTVCCSGLDLEASDNLTITDSKPEQLSGWLGAFKAMINGQQHAFDLVLDMSQSPMIQTQVAPLGYFAPRDDKQALAEALQQLPDLIGVFDKPKYFNYKASICAHSRRGVSGCDLCQQACPAEAIQSAGEQIEVNPSLCQGCGSCTAVCPSGAISYAVPTLDSSLERCRNMLKAYAELEDRPAQLLIHDLLNGEKLVAAVVEQLGANVVIFSIEEIGALGMPFWLAAIAYGAGSVTVLDAMSHSDHDWQALQQQIAFANTLLDAMGYQDMRVHWLQTRKPQALSEHFRQLAATNMIAEKAQFAGLDDKRRVMSLSLNHLHDQAPQSVEVVDLPRGAPFGEIVIDKQACTLCMSCVSVCPAGAVLDGVDKPQLNFVEEQCIQCGMCETACPESAISLTSRYLFDHNARRSKRVLHEEAIFHCISCHKPFATQKMIDTITERLKDHHMFQGAALERLKMCEDCRVKAMF